MYKRFENMFLVVFAVLALGLGFWGYAIAGSNYTASACCVPNCFGPLNPIRPFTWIEALRCLISSIGLLAIQQAGTGTCT